MAESSAPLHEMFFSVQGEGLWVGVPQVFVRVAGCDLACRYCDTAAARRISERWTLSLPGAEPRTETNPVTAQRLGVLLEEWLAVPARPAVHSVALTGGEPLLYPDFVEALGRRLRQLDLRLYLETGGHHPEELARVLPWVDYVALDYKLPSALPEPLPAAVFARSAQLAAGKPCFVKVVVTDRSGEEEFVEACAALAEAAPQTVLVLQPVTGHSEAGGPPTAEQLLAGQARAGGYLPEVRVIPQCHRVMGLR